jgi:hypothetical protein
MREMGRNGGRIGGQRRLVTMSDERRKQIASEAAKARREEERALKLKSGTARRNVVASKDRCYRFSRSQAHQRQFRGAPESQHADADEALHPAYQCIQQKGGETHPLDSAVSDALQLLPDSSDLAGDAGDGSGADGAAVVNS